MPKGAGSASLPVRLRCAVVTAGGGSRWGRAGFAAEELGEMAGIEADKAAGGNESNKAERRDTYTTGILPYNPEGRRRVRARGLQGKDDAAGVVD